MKAELLLSILSLSKVHPSNQSRVRMRVKLTIGLVLFAVTGLLLGVNLQIEGFWFYLLAGVLGYTVLHYMVPKIFGPILFGRIFCGLACWTAMVLDLLPNKTSPGRLPKRGRLRYVHFAISFTIVFITFRVFGYNPVVQQGNVLGGAVYWFLIGNALYFAIGIGLAFWLKDNRAFCKYICPITVFLKAMSRFSYVKIASRQHSCTDCGECDRVCPMDIRVTQYVSSGIRILSTECILCSSCVNACPTKALFWSFQRDIGGIEYIRHRVDFQVMHSTNRCGDKKDCTL